MKLKHTTHGVLSTLAAGTLTAASITITPPLADAQETSSLPTSHNESTGENKALHGKNSNDARFVTEADKSLCNGMDPGEYYRFIKPYNLEDVPSWFDDIFLDGGINFESFHTIEPDHDHIYHSNTLEHPFWANVLGTSAHGVVDEKFIEVLERELGPGITEEDLAKLLEKLGATSDLSIPSNYMEFAELSGEKTGNYYQGSFATGPIEEELLTCEPSITTLVQTIVTTTRETETVTETPPTVTTTLPPSTVVTTVTPDPVTVTETPKTETATATSEVTTTVTSTPPTKTTTLPPVTETVVTTETPEPRTSTITSTEKVPTTITQTPEKETVTTSVTPPTVTVPPVTKTEITTSTEKVPTTVTQTPEKETVTTSVTPPTVTKNIPTTVVTQETITETKEIPTTVVSTEPGAIITVTETPAPVTSTVVAEIPTVTQPAPFTVVENGTAVVHLPEETVTVTPEPETSQQTPVQRVLASTGASVLGLLGVGAGIAALGVFMIRRKK